MLGGLRNERGMAIALVLGILLMLGLVGVAAINNSITDMDISKAMTDRTKSFYTAEGGLEVALATMRNNASIIDADTLVDLATANTSVGDGYFEISMANTYPIRTVKSIGHDREGEAAVAIDVRHRRNPVNPWNNAIFAGVGQAGQAIAGNVDIHGSIHLLGDGEPFTDDNGNGTWDDDDVFSDLNSDGIWQPGEPLTTDHDGDGSWDAAEPFTDDNGNGNYDETLTATDMSFEATGTAGVRNNYDGINATLQSRLPALPTIDFNGETVQTLDAEMRVKHGMVNLDGTATVGKTDATGGSPAIKETVDGMYVNDGYGGDAGESNVYSDNGTTEGYDLPEDAIPFPTLNDTSYGYVDHRAYLADDAVIVAGDLTLKPGEIFTTPPSTKGYLSIDATGHITITGVVIVTGNVYLEKAEGKLSKTPLEYNGRGTLVAGGNMHINNHVLSRDTFPTKDVMGFIAYQDMEIGQADYASQLDLMGAFFSQQSIRSAKQSSIAGAMVSNYFSVIDVPSIYHVPALVDNLPPGMPGGNTFTAYIWKELASTWREIYPVY